MIDLNAVLAAGLAAHERPPDGMLHPSGDLVGPLRHTMLRMAGAPAQPDTIASKIRLRLGTLLHEDFGTMLESQGLPVLKEVKVTEGLPNGWSGTADLLYWDSELRGFHLIDIKTQKAESFQYILQDGPKKEHVWQISTYWHALVKMGYPMVQETTVWYVPVSEDYRVVGGIEPYPASVQPLAGDVIAPVLLERKRLVDEYLLSVSREGLVATPAQRFLTDALAPIPEPEQKLFKKGDKYEVVEMPHWSSLFCPYDDSLCECGVLDNGAKSRKIGEFVYTSESETDGDWMYLPRDGFESVAPQRVPV